MTDEMAIRVDAERAFHDARWSDDRRAGARRFYSVNRSARRDYRARIGITGPGTRVLEYGCGPGSSAFELAEHGADVVGIDISPVAIEAATAEAATRGLVVDFDVMNAEALDFPDGSFDVVCGTGILHHLDLTSAFAEVARVLAPGGTAVFHEPLGHNPLINLYRRLTPAMRTTDEHPLLMADIRAAHRWFQDVTAKYFTLTAIAAAPFTSRPWGRRLADRLDRFDVTLLNGRGRPSRMAWTVNLGLARPIVTPS